VRSLPFSGHPLFSVPLLGSSAWAPFPTHEIYAVSALLMTVLGQQYLNERFFFLSSLLAVFPPVSRTLAASVAPLRFQLITFRGAYVY